MSTYRKQSRKPKPPTQQQLIDQFRRGMEAHGLTVYVDYSTSRYMPSIEISVYPPFDHTNRTDVREEVTAS